MRPPKSTSTRSTPSTRALIQRRRSALIDRLMDEYVCWREECSAVAAAYARWDQATREEQPLAFGAYVAALDREERAAAVYRQLVDRFATVFAPAD
jgi:hypothetical protein